MLKDGYYYPSDEDRAVFKRIIAAVRLNPDWFAPPAAALDLHYSTQALRNRMAAELREHRLNPNHIKRSRAFERKHCQLKAVSIPPKRVKGEDGKPQQPDIELRKRFDIAFQDAFEDELDLDVHELQAGIDIAARRVLLAWLRRDANRGTVQKITEFQELRNKPTEDGIGPLWIPDDAELQNWDKSRFIRQDGGTERDAPNWIKKARNAVEYLRTQSDLTAVLLNAEDCSEVNDKTKANPLGHSPDFTTVDWFGTRYTFAKGNQARAIGVLWEAWENGGHGLTQETIGERIASSADRFELRKTFRQRKPEGGYGPHPAWKTMIQPDGKGNFRLVEPNSR